MTYLLDTNVISEGFRRFPDHEVIEWLDEVPEESTFLSAITIGEVRKGIDRLPLGRRRSNLEAWLTDGLVPGSRAGSSPSMRTSPTCGVARSRRARPMAGRSTPSTRRSEQRRSGTA